MSLPDLYTLLRSGIGEVHGYMLEALLGAGESRHTALQKWALTVDIDRIGASSYRLIPALYAEAGADPVLAPHQGRLKGIYRYFLYRNSRLLAVIERTLRALQQAGVDFILIKGTAVVLQYHPSAALRSFGDCDVLIHLADKPRAEAVLAGLGFGLKEPAGSSPRNRHSDDYTDAAGNGVDLHWHALAECRTPRADDGFWQRSRQITWKGMTLRVLAPEDELLTAMLNGLRDRHQERLDWLYDAATILRAHPAFDWALLRQEALNRKLQIRLARALAVANRFIPDFPAETVEKVFSGEIAEAQARSDAEGELHRLMARLFEEDRAGLLNPVSLLAALRPAVGLRRRIKGMGPRQDPSRDPA